MLLRLIHLFLFQFETLEDLQLLAENQQFLASSKYRYAGKWNLRLPEALSFTFGTLGYQFLYKVFVLGTLHVDFMSVSILGSKVFFLEHSLGCLLYKVKNYNFSDSIVFPLLS